jgi:hypothetical protein
MKQQPSANVAGAMVHVFLLAINRAVESGNIAPTDIAPTQRHWTVPERAPISTWGIAPEVPYGGSV